MKQFQNTVFFLFGIIILILAMATKAQAYAVAVPAAAATSVGQLVNTVGATTAANAASYGITTAVSVPTSAAANAATYAATAVTEIPKSSVVSTVADGLKKGKISPAQVAIGVIGTYLVDKAINVGLKWMDDQKKWGKDAATNLYCEYNACFSSVQSLIIARRGASFYVNSNVAYSEGPYRGNIYFDKDYFGATYYLEKYYLSNGSLYDVARIEQAQTGEVTDAEVDAAASKIADLAGNDQQFLKEVAKVNPMPLPATHPTTINIPNPSITTAPKTISTTTTTNPDGSKTTQTTTETTTSTAPATNPTTVGSPTINITNTTNTTTTTTNIDANGNPVGNPTTETESKPEEEQDIGTVSDSSMPEQPELYEPKYPDGPAGVWNANKPQIESTAFYQGVRSMFPSFGGGTCPSFALPSISLGKFGNFGSGAFNVPCWIFQAIGLILMTTAAFTARKIIF